MKGTDKKIYYIDIDGVIFKNDYTRLDYYEVIPIYENIEKINKLYDEGNIIILWTNRGGISLVDWYTITDNQLYDYGVKFHKLTFDKPYYDVFIDDRAFNSFDDYDKKSE